MKVAQIAQVNQLFQLLNQVRLYGHGFYVAPSKRILIPLSGTFLPVECGMRKILLMESAILGFRIRNTVQGVRNPSNDWNSEFKFH